MRYPKHVKSVTCSKILSFITIFTLCLWFPHIVIDYVCVLDTVGDRGGTVFKVLRYKSECRWLDPSWCHWNFSLT